MRRTTDLELAILGAICWISLAVAIVIFLVVSARAIIMWIGGDL